MIYYLVSSEYNALFPHIMSHCWGAVRGQILLNDNVRRLYDLLIFRMKGMKQVVNRNVRYVRYVYFKRCLFNLLTKGMSFDSSFSVIGSEE